jgi:hypothetical protein
MGSAIRSKRRCSISLPRTAPTRSEPPATLAPSFCSAYDGWATGGVSMKPIVIIACTLTLAACNRSSKVDEKNASVAEVAQKVREASADQSFVRPGRWESKVTIDKFEVPGMPPEMAQRMKSMMAEKQEHGFITCLTPEDVKRPKEDFFAGKNNECRYDHFTMGGGKIDAVMRCNGTSGSAPVMQMAGTYSPDSYQMQTSMKMDGGSGTQEGMSMQMRIEAHRVGECTGKEDG